MTTEERLEELEKEQARAKRRSRAMLAAAVAMAAVAIVAVVLLLGYGRRTSKVQLSTSLSGAGRDSVQDVVRAKRFELVDASDTIRAVLGMRKTGRPGLWLRDQNGEVRACLAMNDSDGTPFLCLYDSTGSDELKLDTKEPPGLYLYDQQNDRPRVGLSLDDSGRSMLTLRDRNDTVRAALVVFDSSSVLGLTDPNGKTRALLGVGYRSSSLCLSDSTDTTRADLKASDYAGPRLGLFDPHGKPTLLSAP